MLKCRQQLRTARSIHSCKDCLGTGQTPDTWVQQGHSLVMVGGDPGNRSSNSCCGRAGDHRHQPQGGHCQHVVVVHCRCTGEGRTAQTVSAAPNPGQRPELRQPRTI
jgi:hypothetical protein